MAERQYTQEQTDTWMGIYQHNTLPMSLSKRFATVAHNLCLQKGMYHTRPGMRQLNGVQFGSSGKRTIYGIDLWKTASSDTFIVAAGDLIQSLPVTGGDPVTLTTSYPSSFRSSVTGAATVFAHLGGQLFIVNGVDANIKYNGTNVTRMGLVAPSTLAAPSKSAGSITGKRSYVATLVSSTLNGSAESEPTSATIVDYTDQQGTFSSPTVPSSDPQVDRWNLYATMEGQSTYHKVNSSPVTLVTTIVDNLSDTTLSAALDIDASGTNAPPPAAFGTLCVHQGRLVGAPLNSNDLYWSDLGLDLGGVFAKPESWPAVNRLEFPESGGNTITALISFYEWIVVFQNFGIWAINSDLASDGRDITPVLVAPDYRGLGVASQQQVAVMDNQIVFAGKNGAYAIARKTSLLSSNLTVAPLTKNIDKLYQQINFNNGAASVADRDNGRWIFVGKGRS